MDTPDLTADQEAEAQRLFALLKQTADSDLLALARLLASKDDAHLFGATEFAARDHALAIAAKAFAAACAGRKKGATTAPRAPAPTAKGRRASNAGRAAAS